MGILLSFLRKIKHRVAPVDDKDAKDEVWLLDNIAVPSPGSSNPPQWKSEYVVAFFKENQDVRERIGSTIASLLQTLNLAPGDNATEERIKERIAPFLRQIGPHLEVDVNYEGDPGATLHLGPSNDNGIFSKDLDVPVGSSSSGFSPGNSKIMRVAHRETESPEENSATAKLEMGRTLFAADLPSSFGVISDIDDTIKITEVRDRLKLLQHTFIDLPSAVPGMVPFYQKLYEVVSTPSSPSPFVYLSASPYNLYPFLREFVRGAGFPDGMIILRDMSWMDMESFILSLTVGTQEYKEDRMKKVARWLPHTTWVCIGDSTQKDPESYANFYKRQLSNTQGGRVARIWIHKVVGVNLSAEKSLNAPERFEKAFKDVPKEITKVFENADELYAELDALKQEVTAAGQKATQGL